MKKWKRYNFFLDEKKRIELKKRLNLPDYIISVLVNRGFDNFEKVREILDIYNMEYHSPFLFEDMEKVINRINTGMINNEQITIYGDYDVDGVTAISILHNFFTYYLKYKKIDFYIPHREEEGYGLNKEAIDILKNKGTTLIITVDCGINAKEEVSYANKKSIDVIITDHHIPDEGNIPQDAIGIINPKLSKNYPEKELSGVGTAYKLLCALAKIKKIDIKDEFLDFVALGTIADIVPLTIENRILVREGIKKIKNTQNIGLKALKEKAGLKNDSKITSYHIGYILGPRINAAGRMEHAKKAVELFLTKDENTSLKIAEELNAINEKRKIEMKKTEKEAIEILESTFSPLNDYVIVVYKEDWSKGVIGLVASQIVKKYNRPTFVLTEGEDGFIHGSARSVFNVNIFELIKEVREVLENYGGHKLAAGVTLKKENIENFKNKMNEILRARYSIDDFTPILYYDDIIEDTINIQNIKIFEKLEPWGEGNPEPVFIFNDVEIIDVKFFKNNTMKFYGKHNKKFYNFILYRHTEEDEEKIKKGKFLNIAFSVNINKWNGEENLILEVKDYIEKL